MFYIIKDVVFSPPAIHTVSLRLHILLALKESERVSLSVMSHSLGPPWSVACQDPLWDSPGENTGVSCHSLLQGIFPTQILNPDLLYQRQILYCLSHQGSPTFRRIGKLMTSSTKGWENRPTAHECSLVIHTRQIFWHGNVVNDGRLYFKRIFSKIRNRNELNWTKSLERSSLKLLLVRSLFLT